jgi:putative ABC transport system permease protein
VDKSASYVVRAKPQHLASAMRAAQARLFELRAARILRKVGTFAEWRERDYRDDRGLATILAIVCAALVAVTAFGIVGLTSYWVAQRRRQIGIRRALGATRSAIVRHFQTENLLIAGAGAVLGVGLAVVINIWMIKSFEMARLDPTYAVLGAAAVVLLGQLATLWPALRAAAIAPALATRGA